MACVHVCRCAFASVHLTVCVLKYKCMCGCIRMQIRISVSCGLDWCSAYVCYCVYSCVYTVYVHVCVWSFIERSCVCGGGGNVEVNYAFFTGEGCIYVCVYVGGMGGSQSMHVCVCMSVCVRECVHE